MTVSAKMTRLAFCSIFLLTGVVFSEQPALRTSGTSEFKCGSDNVWIPAQWQCDGDADCEDGSDEKPPTCPSVTCSSDEFQCANGKCLAMKQRCDQDNNCGYNSDEDNCAKPTCPPDNFQCANNHCIPNRWHCDGDMDCIDKSDETYCSTSTISSHCGSVEFRCKSGQCIHRSWRCDSDPDCRDGSDEENCGEQTCGPNQFQCSTSTRTGPSCVLVVQQCDKHADCDDGSDEQDCPSEETGCDPHTQFDCYKDGQNCIPLEKVCNNVSDCGAAEDESPAICSSNVTNPCLNETGGCTQNCENNVNGFFCTCNPGFELQADNRTCEDIDECATSGTCSQSCHNTNGGYKCSCHDGYFIEPTNPHRCKASGVEPSLIFANRRDIRELKMQTHEYLHLVDKQRSAVALDFDFKRNHLYWSDVAEQRILTINLSKTHHNNGKPDVIVQTDISTPDGIALDWIHNNLYWTDTGKDRIEMINLQTRMRKTLIHTRLEEPRAIVVDPRDEQGFMYWTDWGKDAKIEKAGMDGMHRTAIVSLGIKWPNGLAIDYVDNRLYWVDAKLHFISSSNLEGQKRHIVLTSIHYLLHPFALAVFEDTVYWTDWDTEAVHCASKFNGTNVQNVQHGLITPMDIQVFHPLKQPYSLNRCEVDNGGCSHICLPAPYLYADSSKYSCHCELDYPLAADMRTCLVP